jgi:hypothetical protein
MGTPWRRVLLVLLGAAWALPHEHFFHGDAVDPGLARVFGAGLIVVGLYQAIRGWGFDVDGWRSRRTRLREARRRRARRRDGPG